ncbi:MAG: MBL fold metallo-hydrolase [Candidatus Onthomonas sp.]
MKVHVLMEDTACREGICAEHGLSLYLETDRHRLLFDAGQSGRFADNARRMGVALADVDLAVLSHGHYDHGGGLETFLACNQTAPVYLSRFAFQPHYSGQERYIGLNPALEKNQRLVPVGDYLKLDETMELFSCNNRPCPFPADPYGLYLGIGEQRIAEDFRHEQYLLIQENGRRILVSGCSHKGVLNLMEWFRPDVLIGGFHFFKLDPEGPERETLLAAARQLAQYPAVYYSGHCTGEAQLSLLKTVLGERIQPIRAGMSFTV